MSNNKIPNKEQEIKNNAQGMMNKPACPNVSAGRGKQIT